MSRRYAEEPGRSARGSGQVPPVSERPVAENPVAESSAKAPTVPAGGLVQLGSAEGAVCEDGICWPTPPAAE